MPKPELRTAALPTLTVLVRFGFGGSDLVDFKLLARVPAGFSINVNVKRRAPFAPWQPHQACGRERERESSDRQGCALSPALSTTVPRLSWILLHPREDKGPVVVRSVVYLGR